MALPPLQPPILPAFSASHPCGACLRGCYETERFSFVGQGEAEVLSMAFVVCSRCEVVPAQERWRASVSLAAPSTFVMRLML